MTTRERATWHLREAARFYSAARHLADTSGTDDRGRLLRAWDAMARCVEHLMARREAIDT